MKTRSREARRSNPARRSRRAGFSLPELLVVAVLGSVVVMSTYQVVVTNQRVYAVQQVQIQGQQTTRTGIDVLFAELREISTRGGDLTEMSETSLTVRVPRSAGHICAIASPIITVRYQGRTFNGQDSLFVFQDREPKSFNDDEWLLTPPPSVITDTTCGGASAQALTVASLDIPLTDGSIRVGAPVRAFTTYEYGLFQVGSAWYLARRTPGSGTTDPLVGPLQAQDGGVRFIYLDAVGTPTANAEDVAQIRVTLATDSNLRDTQGALVRDSLVATVHPRN